MSFKVLLDKQTVISSRVVDHVQLIPQIGKNQALKLAVEKVDPKQESNLTLSNVTVLVLALILTMHCPFKIK